MTLNRQLWLAIVIILILAFCGTFTVSTLSARRYLQQELKLKNIDNATSLALSISQLPKDEVTIELLLAAQFDAGHYRLIQLSDPNGKVLVEKTSLAGSSDSGAPSWFVRTFPIVIPPGLAQIQDGWRQYGSLRVESHDRYAYAALWKGTKQLLAWFALVAMLAGLVGSGLLRIILKPLYRVVAQAEAIGGRQFITTPEPGTLEFQRLVRAMNTLSQKVRDMLNIEAGRVEDLLRQSQFDAVTNLLKREAFMSKFDAMLAQDSRHSTGTLSILRIASLAELNREIGHVATDKMLRTIGDKLNAFAARHTTLWVAGRLGGADFALLAPGETDALETATQFMTEVQTAIQAAIPHADVELENLAVGATHFVPKTPRSAALIRVDEALNQSTEMGHIVVRDEIDDRADKLPTDLPGWRQLLTSALTMDAVSLQRFPVVGAQGQLLHFESPVRLNIGDRTLAAGQFIAWVTRLGWLTQLDKLVVNAAMREIQASGDAIAVNLSTESIGDPAFVAELVRLLQQNPDLASKLWLDVPEHGALLHLDEFREFCHTLKPLRCQLGLKHAGPGFARIGEVHDLGLNHLKLDAAFSREIDQDDGNQRFVRGVCTLVHSIGMLAIAEGITTEAELQCMQNLGADAMTGPGVRRDEPAA